MRGKFIFLALASAFIVCACTEKQPGPPPEDNKFLSTDSVVNLTAEDTSGKEYSLFVPFTRDDRPLPPPPREPEPTDTAMLRTTPDFTDNGVGMLLQQTARENPSLITTCIVPQFLQFFSSTPPQPCAGPYIGGFSAPDPALPVPPQCLPGGLVVWRTTGNQLARWGTTSPAVRNQFISHMMAYQGAVAAGYFPLFVEGLSFGGSSCLPYSSASLQIFTNPGGGTNFWKIVLTP